MFESNEIHIDEKYKSGKFSRNLIKDINWVIKSIIKNKNPMIFLKWIHTFKRYFKGNERFDVERINDFKPTIYLWSEIIKEFIEKVELGLNLIYYNLYFKLFKSKHKSKIKIKKTDKILFMCKGNINRSAFAEKYLNQKYGFKSESCGSIFKNDRQTTNISEKVSKKMFVDLSNHKSKSIFCIQKINKFNKIIIFDLRNYLFLKRKYPELLNKVIFLNSDIHNFTIVDPYSKCESEYVKVYKLIKSSIDIAVNKNG